MTATNRYLDIRNISASELRMGNYRVQLPGLYALQTVIENGPWHEHQSVFDHTVLVYEHFLRVVDLLGRRKAEASEAVRQHLEETVSGRTKFELGAIAILFHDLAKFYTNTRHANGTTSNPCHELFALGMLDEATSVFQLDVTQRDWVARYIQFHGLVSQTINFSLYSEHAKSIQQLFLAIVGDQAIDLLIFIWCDVLGSDLRKADSELFDRFERKILQVLAQIVEL